MSEHIVYEAHGAPGAQLKLQYVNAGLSNIRYLFRCFADCSINTETGINIAEQYTGITFEMFQNCSRSSLPCCCGRRYETPFVCLRTEALIPLKTSLRPVFGGTLPIRRDYLYANPIASPKSRSRCRFPTQIRYFCSALQRKQDCLHPQQRSQGFCINDFLRTFFAEARAMCDWKLALSKQMQNDFSENRNCIQVE